MSNSYILGDYDRALEHVLNNGKLKKNRTGVDTLSTFGVQCRYDISERFPIPTRRKVWPKAIFAELLWFISGSTNNKDLQALGSNIWTPWVNKQFEYEHMYQPGVLGPIYGAQLRNFGMYQYWSDGRCSGGFDQLEYMVETLKKDPDSRRNLFSLWNPRDLDLQVLPPCHYSLQVYVEDGKLSGMMTQRSCDMFIGCPSNIYSYSALLYMLAQQTGYQPYEFIHSIGSAHIYLNHLDGVKEYLSRDIPDSPRLAVKQEKSIYDYKIDDFQVLDYNPLPPIKVPVAV